VSAPVHPLVLVGGGRMGAALLEGWLARGLSAGEAWVVEPDATRRRVLGARAPGARIVAGVAEIPADLAPAALVFAVKPQVLDGILPAWRPVAARSRFVLSIVAGKPVAAFTRALGAETVVVRTMPNTPAAVGAGMTVLYAPAGTPPEVRTAAAGLMRAVGEVAWIENEDAMHAVTAVSGSGPAYVFLLVEALTEAGRRLGLDADLATTLARHTVAGAGRLLLESGEDAAALRRGVTSPGGTTEAALGVLRREGGLVDLLAEAVAAAARRSRELAGEEGNGRGREGDGEGAGT